MASHARIEQTRFPRRRLLPAAHLRPPVDDLDFLGLWLSEYEASGLTQAEFARRNGVVYTTLAHRVQQRRREAKAGMASARFVEVRPALPAAAPMAVAAPAAVTDLSVTLPDGVVVRGADPVALAALVRALRTN